MTILSFFFFSTFLLWKTQNSRKAPSWTKHSVLSNLNNSSVMTTCSKWLVCECKDLGWGHMRGGEVRKSEKIKWSRPERQQPVQWTKRERYNEKRRTCNICAFDVPPTGLYPFGFLQDRSERLIHLFVCVSSVKCVERAWELLIVREEQCCFRGMCLSDYSG